ncbi:MAG: hypothetical protein PHR96_00880 [Clostridia bacterium]|nr:hypothetical protein [Clostridia bacterium]
MPVKSDTPPAECFLSQRLKKQKQNILFCFKDCLWQSYSAGVGFALALSTNKSRL